MEFHDLFTLTRAAPLVAAWLRDIIDHTRPARLHIYGEDERAAQKGVTSDEGSSPSAGTPLAASFDDVSDPGANVRAFVCSQNPPAPGTPWMSRAEVESWGWRPLSGSMEGSTMFVIPYLLRTLTSPLGGLGVEVTDSRDLAAALYGMAQVERVTVERLGRRADFHKGVHLARGHHACAPFFVRLPQEKTTLSIGMGARETCRLIAESHRLGAKQSPVQRALRLVV